MLHVCLPKKREKEEKGKKYKVMHLFGVLTTLEAEACSASERGVKRDIMTIDLDCSSVAGGHVVSGTGYRYW